jgi:AraC-like DNA-binding protein
MSRSMTALEAGLRGGAIALLLLLAIVGWRDARRAAVARYAVLFDVCAIAYLIESAPPLAAVSPPWLVPIRILSTATPAVFQLWAAANFDDAFVPKWWRWLPFGAIAAVAFWAILTDWTLAWRAAQFAAFLLVGTGIWQALAGREADLIERRRQFRLVLAIGLGLGIAALTLRGLAGSQGLGSAETALRAGGVLALVLAAALLRLGLEPWPGLQPEQDAVVARSFRLPGAPSLPIDAAEQALLDRLRRLMEHDRAYREEGFGIALLAARMTIPEYRLRRLINQHLGHRNFTTFVNGYRLAEAMAALTDPSQRQVPILTIALDAGFQSIGPFNRAFKAHTGLTPTAFRRDRLSRDQAPAAG